TGGMTVDGGESKKNSRLEIHYKLDQPVQLQKIWDWYDQHLTSKGWSGYQDTYSLHFKKKVGDRYHGIGITYDYKSAMTGENVVDSYTVGYGIGYEGAPPGG
ncbi:MAG: hypothetical protein DYH08_15040, partial [Actinobacteria bacterium ATB1]|nr:hypothetical protein [Actinobacteria bacterium ATB1]